jgi:type VI secretion system protein ImpA
MTAPDVLDFETLLRPIEGESPGGSNPRDDTSVSSLYYRVKDLRNAARAAERAALDPNAAPPQDWRAVSDAAIKLISTQSKDLESAAWLAEAMLRLEGYPGLRDAFRLIQGLVEKFWEDLYPRADEEGIESKLAPIAGLNGAGANGPLERAIRMVPLVESASGAYSLWHYEQALDLVRITDEKRLQARLNDGAITLEQFNQAVSDASPQDIVATLGAVEECQAAFAAMSTAVDQVAGADSPSFSAVRDLLERVAGNIRHFGADKIAAAAVMTEQAEVADGSGAAEESAGGRGGVKVDGFANREEALAALTRIAAYFRKTEPHSPISYTIEDAVRRARMSLVDLLTELSQDPKHAAGILHAAGIKTATGAEG